ncbi:MAG: hypothetical protein K940chlam5_01679 [Candidatus Anoxychlamydiales bacterium]|nr:hypothetical protein [Candidatus Anoxychlamydiales bacterium]
MTSLSNLYQFFFPAVNIEQQGHLQEVVVKTWSLIGRDVHLIRSGDRLEYKLTYHHGITKRCVINIPQGKSIEQAIAHLMTLDVSVNDHDIVSFAKKISISQLDNHSIINNDHWAVTLAVAGKCKINPKTWGGHAVLFIEMVENDVYVMKIADLVSGGCGKKGCFGAVDIGELSKFDHKKIKSQSVTWVRSKTLIQQMICDIEQQKLAQDNGSTPVKLALRGQNAFLVGEIAHNCFTWARETLKIANIHLWQESTIVTPIAIIPKSVISPTSLSSKERIIVQIKINGSNLKKFDITQEIDAFVEHRPWKLALNDKGEIMNLRADCIVDQNDERFNRKSDTLIIKLIVDDEKVLEIDVTKLIKRKVREEEEKNDTPMHIDRIIDPIINAVFNIVFAVPLLVLDLLPTK